MPCDLGMVQGRDEWESWLQTHHEGLGTMEIMARIHIRHQPKPSMWPNLGLRLSVEIQSHGLAERLLYISHTEINLGMGEMTAQKHPQLNPSISGHHLSTKLSPTPNVGCAHPSLLQKCSLCPALQQCTMTRCSTSQHLHPAGSH